MTVQLESNPEVPSGAYTKRNFVWCIAHILLGPFFSFWMRTRAIGLENIDNTQGGIFLINHQSFLDPLITAVRLRRPVSYLARDSLFRVPLIGTILRLTYVIPISRTAFRGSSIRQAVERLEQGFLVGMFPEGTRSSGTNVQQFRAGFLALIRRSQVPVYPVAIHGADKAMPKGSWFVRPAAITVTYGKPYTPEQVQELLESHDDKAFAEIMRSRVTELLTGSE